jgi:[NiFe] hydrogenase diaphorase moiety large subunit
VVCNADEGEPGTFKDRVILTEKADQMFEGMAIGGYAIGATDGILYLRAEYAYLQKFLEDILQQRRKAGLLGHNVAGKEGFNFDIRIQMGAGAYVCGEETALLSSCEGTRGDPKNRPPFPAQKGYLGHPTIINNVETYAAVARVVEKGAGWFAESGSKGSPGSKVLSISGDCKQPGVYEVPFGTTLHEIVEMTGARNVAAIQVGGPSGQLVPPDQFGRCICYDDLATGGSVMIFNQDRDLMWVVEKFMDFFIEESCGYCTPCRVGNVLLKEGLDKLRDGKGETADLNYLTELGTTVKRTSRCGLGQTSPNPVLSLLENFPQLVQAKLQSETAFQPTFSIQDALADSSALAGRRSQIYG